MTEMIRMNLSLCYTSGNRKSWFKRVTKVDKTKKDGYAFDGEFLPGDKEIELPVGAVIIEKEPGGSVKNSTWTGKIYVVVAEPDEKRCNAHLALKARYDWQSEFLSFRDMVAEYLQQSASCEEEKPANKAQLQLVNNQLAELQTQIASYLDDNDLPGSPDAPETWAKVCEELRHELLELAEKLRG